MRSHLLQVSVDVLSEGSWLHWDTQVWGHSSFWLVFIISHVDKLSIFFV